MTKPRVQYYNNAEFNVDNEKTYPGVNILITVEAYQGFDIFTGYYYKSWFKFSLSGWRISKCQHEL